MSYNEADTRAKILVLVILFSVGVVARFLSEVEIEDEPARINYVPTVTWTISANIGTASISTPTTL